MSYFPPPSHSSSSNEIYGSVLIIENDEMVCDALHDILSDSGYQVFVAHDGLEGEQMYRSMVHDIDVIILDWRLPKQDGRDTLYKIRELNPKAQVMISSGFAEEEVTGQLSSEQSVAFLGKPFDIDHLLNQVRKLMA